VARSTGLVRPQGHSSSCTQFSLQASHFHRSVQRHPVSGVGCARIRPCRSSSHRKRQGWSVQTARSPSRSWSTRPGVGSLSGVPPATIDGLPPNRVRRKLAPRASLRRLRNCRDSISVFDLPCALRYFRSPWPTIYPIPATSSRYAPSVNPVH